MTKKYYKEVRTIAGPSIRTTKGERPFQTVCIIDATGDELVSEMLSEGWEIIHIITNHSVEYDATSVAYILGLPQSCKTSRKIFKKNFYLKKIICYFFF